MTVWRDGLRRLERLLPKPLPPRPGSIGSATFTAAAAALHAAVPDHGRASPGPRSSSLSAVAALVATKFKQLRQLCRAGFSRSSTTLSAWAVYAILSPLVASSDAALDEHALRGFARPLTASARVHLADAIADKGCTPASAMSKPGAHRGRYRAEPHGRQVNLS